MTYWLDKIFMGSLKFFKWITFYMYSIELIPNRDMYLMSMCSDSPQRR